MLTFSGMTDIGKTRKINQDSFCMHGRDDAGLFAVADGMGGYADGEKASREIIEELSLWWDAFERDRYAGGFRSMISSIERAIERANSRIYARLNQGGVCGSTVVALFIHHDMYGVIYAGDSRCYASQEGRVKQLTVDEVWENQTGVSYAERSLPNHPNRGKLTNAVGVRKTARCRVLTDIVTPGMAFLLCSDGLYKFCEDRALNHSLINANDKRSMEKAMQKLLKEAYRNGAKDNISMILVKCSHAAASPCDS